MSRPPIRQQHADLGNQSVRSQGTRASTVGTLEPLPSAAVMTQLNETVVVVGSFS